MTANFELSLTLNGTEQQLKDMLEVVKEYATRGKRDAWFDFVTVRKGEATGKLNDNPASESESDALVAGGGSVEVTAIGPYGSYNELDDVEMFNELAEAAPQATFEAVIRGSRGSMEENLVCRLENGLLRFRQEKADYDEIEETYKDWFSESLPVEEFAEWFGLDEDAIDEDSYWDLLNELVICNSGALHELPYDEFVNCLDNTMIEAEVDEETYTAAMEKVKERHPDSFDTFREEYEGDVVEYTYNPVTRKIISGRT